MSVLQPPRNIVQLQGSTLAEESLPVSIVKDEDGLGVLRFVDAAPHGYDSVLDAVQVNDVRGWTLAKEVTVDWATLAQINVGVTHTVFGTTVIEPFDARGLRDILIVVHNAHDVAGVMWVYGYKDQTTFLSSAIETASMWRVPIGGTAPNYSVALGAGTKVGVSSTVVPALAAPGAAFVVSVARNVAPASGTATIWVFTR
jgi:hypothetical protein